MRTAQGLVPVILVCLAFAAPIVPGAERPAMTATAAAEVHAVDGGSWSSTLMQTATPWACGAAGTPTRCAEHSVVIDNRSAQTLECAAAFSTRTGAGPTLDGADLPALVLPRTTHEIRGPITVTTA